VIPSPPAGGVASGTSAGDVDDAGALGSAVGSPVAAVLVGEAVMAGSVAPSVGAGVAAGSVGRAAGSVVALGSDVAVGEAEMSVGDAETESVGGTASVGVAVGTEPSSARVVVAEMETRVLTLVEPDAPLPGLLELNASASSGVSRTVIFSMTVVVSLMFVAGSRFSWRS